MINNTAMIKPTENKTQIVYILFCVWTLVLLCRPQDIFPVLIPLRPALVTGILTMGVVAVHFKDLQGPPYFQERQVKYYTALLLIMILGIPFSLYARLSFMIIFTQYISVAMFFFVFYKCVDSVEKLSTVLLLSCLGSGLYAAFSVVTGSMGAGRLSFGGMFDPNDLAYFALGFLPLNLVFISRNNPIWVRLACFGCFFVNVQLILLTGSRGGLLGFGVAAILLLLLKTQTIKFSHKIVFVALCIVIVSFSPINTERFNTLFSIEEDYNVVGEAGRITIWKIGMRATLANPFTGVGVGCFGNAVGQDRINRDASTLKWQTAHNSIVQIATETGVIGMVLFLLLSRNVIVIFLRLKKTSESDKLVRLAEMGLVGFAGLFTASFFISQAYSSYWVFYIAFSAVGNQLIMKERALSDEPGPPLLTHQDFGDVVGAKSLVVGDVSAKVLVAGVLAKSVRDHSHLLTSEKVNL